MKFPVFPLNGAILFTKTNLPLNIFEQKYLDMVDYSLSKDRCIGMIQTKEDDSLYEIGCLGKIVGFNETSDNRYLINLLGRSYFRVLKEDSSKYKFRIVDAEILNASPEFLKLLQKFDLENQLTGDTIYDNYSTILKKQRDQKKVIPKTK